MKIKEFLHGERGAVAIEYVILVAMAAALLGAGVWALMDAMSGLFAAWATYFGAGS
jgi:Flp pilus assembly pilin Flp